MKKKIVVCFVTMLLLCGCGDVSQKVNGNEDVNKGIMQDSDWSVKDSKTGVYKIDLKLDDNIYVCGEYEMPDCDTYNVYIAKQKDIPKEELIEKIFNGKNDVKFLEEDDEWYRLEDEKIAFTHMGAGAYNYGIRKNIAFYMNALSSNEYYMNRGSFDDIEFVNGGFDKEVSVTKKEAVDIVKKFADELELELADEPELVISLDESAMEQLDKLNEIDERFERNYSECVYMVWRYEIDGLKLLDGNLNDNFVDSLKCNGASLVAVVNNEGIAWLYAFNLCGNYEKIEEHNNIITAKEAAEKIMDKYKNIIVSGKIVFDKIELNYVPIISTLERIEYTMVPAWVFQAEITDKEFGDKKIIMMQINAITGEII